MARYRTFTGKRGGIHCDVLNENCGGYLVRFSNGVLKNVPGYRVYDLDKIDEGVLDTIRSAAKKVRDFAVDVVKRGKFLFFRNDGKNMMICPPVNIMSLSGSDKKIRVFADSGLREVADHYGIAVSKPKVDSVDSDEMSWSVVSPDEFMKLCAVPANESLNEAFPYKQKYSPDDFYNPENDAEQRAKKHVVGDKKHPLIPIEPTKDEKLKGKKLVPITQTEVWDILEDEYNRVLETGEWGGHPICLYGVPGIAKSATIKLFSDYILSSPEYRDRGDFKFTAITLNGMRPFELTYPVTKNTKVKDVNGNEREDVRSIDIVKQWFPGYSPMNAEDVPGKEDELMFIREWQDDVANGGHHSSGATDYNLYMEDSKNWKRGMGGILFIDEYSRAATDVLHTIMTIFSDKRLGTSPYRMGSKWMIVLAANGKSDMGIEPYDTDPTDPAHNTRTTNRQFTLRLGEWLNWAENESRGLSGKMEPNILPEITDFLKNPAYNWCFYHMSRPAKDDDEFDFTALNKANPRTWEAFSNAIKLRLGGADYDKLFNGKDLEFNKEFENVLEEIQKCKGFKEIPGGFDETNPKHMAYLKRRISNYIDDLRLARKMNFKNGKGEYKSMYDLWKNNHKYFMDEAISILGMDVARMFDEYYKTLGAFSKDQARRVWTDPDNVDASFGGCDDFVLGQSVAEMIVSENPNKDSANPFPENGLKNIIKYIVKLIYTTGVDTGGRQAWRPSFDNMVKVFSDNIYNKADKMGLLKKPEGIPVYVFAKVLENIKRKAKGFGAYIEDMGKDINMKVDSEFNDVMQKLKSGNNA